MSTEQVETPVAVETTEAAAAPAKGKEKRQRKAPEELYDLTKPIPKVCNFVAKYLIQKEGILGCILGCNSMSLSQSLDRLENEVNDIIVIDLKKIMECETAVGAEKH